MRKIVLVSTVNKDCVLYLVLVMKQLSESLLRDRGTRFGREEAILKLIDHYLANGSRMLNVGCGTGWLEAALLRNQPKRLELTGIDLDEVSISLCRARGLDGVRFSTSSPIDYLRQNEYFDICACIDVIEHVPSGTEQSFINDVAAVLKPGGFLIVTTPYASFRSMISDPAFLILGHRHYTFDQLERLTLLAGLRSISLDAKGNLYDALEIYDNLISKWLFRRPPLFAALYRRSIQRAYSRCRGYMNLFGVFQKS